MALRHMGFLDAAQEALKSRSRDAAIWHIALLERSDNYLDQNEKKPCLNPEESPISKIEIVTTRVRDRIEGAPGDR